MASENQLIQAPIEPVQGGPLLDMRRGFLSMTPENMELALAQYDARRKVFRDWLKSKLVKGVHYGYPPGCEPESQIINGKLHYNNRGKWYPAEQWTPKPSLYKPTGDMLCECLALRDEYDADMDAWKQLGEPKLTFVMRCRLYSMTSGELVAEGRGVYAVGDKKADANQAIKKSKKSAKIDAVINYLGISDLFTQDMDELPPPIYDNPGCNPDAPIAAPRGDRVSADDFKKIGTRWREMRKKQSLPTCKVDWEDFFESHTGLPREQATQHTAWSLLDLEKLGAGIASEMNIGSEPPVQKGTGELFSNDGGETYAR